jgi:TRAP-type C4-dicarboxylate transport system permease small subunit
MTLDRGVSRATEYALFGVGATFTGLVLAQVVARFVFDFSLFFIDALTGFLFVWFLMLGSGLAIKHRLHVGFGFLIERLPPRLAPAVEAVAHALTFAFFGFIIWASADAIPSSLRTMSPSLGLSMFWAVVAIPIGFALMIFHQVSIVLSRYVWPDRVSGATGAPYMTGGL